MKNFLKNKFLPFFLLIRYYNLIVIILTSYLLRLTILMPLFNNAGFAPSMNILIFTILVLTIVMITAAGYIINDCFDVVTDRFNKPDRVLIGTRFSRREAIVFYIILNVLATFTGFFVAWTSGSPKIGFIFPMTSVLLWLYSARYKRLIVWGNIVVALLSSLVISILWLFEFLTLRSMPDAFVAMIGSMGLINRLFIAFSLFAFMLTMIREVLKDAEDIEGDGQTGCRTFAVVYGLSAVKILALYLSVSTLFLLLFALGWLFNAGFLIVAVYLTIAVFLPLIFLLFRINSANDKQDFKQLSNLFKLLMLAGILSMPLLALAL